MHPTMLFMECCMHTHQALQSGNTPAGWWTSQLLILPSAHLIVLIDGVRALQVLPLHQAPASAASQRRCCAAQPHGRRYCLLAVPEGSEVEVHCDHGWKAMVVAITPSSYP